MTALPDRIARKLDAASTLRLRRATVTAVTSSGPPARVDLELADGSTIPGAPCSRAYSPAAGHHVGVLVDGDGTVYVLG